MTYVLNSGGGKRDESGHLQLDKELDFPT